MITVFLFIPFSDLLWADPDQWAKGWQANTRGVSYVFGQDVVVDACNKLEIDLVARAHQVSLVLALEIINLLV